MRVGLFVMALTFGCEAAPLQTQSSATFAATFGCDINHVSMTRARGPERPGAYEVWVVQGCGHLQTYVCATDVGCVRPEEAPPSFTGGPAYTMPPTLVDQVPSPPPPSHEEEGS